jgi:RNA-directed DNA polymerase
MSQKTNHPIGKVRQLQRKLYLSAKQSKTRRFHALYERVHNKEVLEESWKRVRSNKGASGIDGQTLEEIETQGVNAFQKGIEQYLKEGRYHPLAVRKVDIPKPDGSTRPLGIPTVRDRIVQMAAKIVLEPVFEADFKDSSFGYRPKRGTLEAMEKIRKVANQGHNFILDVDIRNYFGSINHMKLITAIERRVSDRRTLKLTRKWLKAVVMSKGEFEESLVGTPQGGVISPLLSNIYLHQLDESWERNSGKLGVLVRYCDDFIILCRTWQNAREARRRVRELLKELSLELHPDKTKEVRISRGMKGFEFLGWYARKTPSARFPGKHFLNRWPSPRSMKRLYAKIRSVIHRRTGVKDPKEFAGKLNPVLRGWTNYFRTGNSRNKFQQVDKYLWMRLVLFENKRRKNVGPYWSRRRWTHDWYEGLGFFDLIKPGLIRYPGVTYANA